MQRRILIFSFILGSISLLCWYRGTTAPTWLASNGGGQGPGVVQGKTNNDLTASDLFLAQPQTGVAADWQAGLLAAGVEIGEPLGNGAFLVRVPSGQGQETMQKSGVALEPYHPARRLAPALHTPVTKSEQTICLTVSAFTAADKDEVARVVEQYGGEVLKGREEAGNVLRVRLPAEHLADLSRHHTVTYIEPYQPASLLNDRARSVIGAAPLAVPGFATATGLTGQGQVVALADSGLDQGKLEALPPDFASTPGQKPKVIMLKSWAGQPVPADQVGHGTHMAATIAGTGAASGGKYRGMAAGASLYVQAILNAANELDPPANLGELLRPAYEAGARVHVNGWGGQTNAYQSAAAQVDAFMRRYPDFSAIFGAGNSGPGAKSITPEANSKNALVVGASQNPRPGFGAEAAAADRTAAFSSLGPAADGRVKPDLLAPGTAIISACSPYLQSNFAANSSYTKMQGTSMAAAVTGGAVALLREYFQKEGEVFFPSAALCKAALINGALGGTGDFAKQGFGIMDLGGTVLALREKQFQFADELTGVAAGAKQVYRYRVASAEAPLKITLTWTDPAAAPGTAAALVNDLDLVVRGPDGREYLGNHLLHLGSADRLNNVEQVQLLHPAVGEYTITVQGTRIDKGAVAGSSRLAQDFALVYGQPLVKQAVSSLTGAGQATLNDGQVVTLLPETSKYVLGDRLVTGGLSQVKPGTDLYLGGVHSYLVGGVWRSSGVQALSTTTGTLLMEIEARLREGGYYLDPAAPAALWLNGAPLADATALPPGVEVEAAINPSTQTCWLVRAGCREVDGFLEWIDPAQKQIRLLHDATVYELSSRAALSLVDTIVDGSYADLPFGAGATNGIEKLLPGLSVHLVLSSTTGEVLYLAGKRPLVTGTLQQVDAGQGTITLNTGRTYHVLTGAALRRDHREAQLADLQVGDHLAAVLLPGTQDLIELAADSLVNYGKILFCSEKQQSLFLLDYQNNFRMYTLTARTKVFRWGLAAEPDVIMQGAWVRVTLDPGGTKIRRLDIAEVKEEVLKAVDRFDPDRVRLFTNDEMVYQITPYTQVTKNGYRVGVAEILPGETVRLTTLAAPGAAVPVVAALGANTKPKVAVPSLDITALPREGYCLLTGVTTATRLYLYRDYREPEVLTVDEQGRIAFRLYPGPTERAIQLVGVDGRTGGITGQTITFPEGGTGSFSDLNGHWAAGDIRALAAAGVVAGYPDGTFRPDQPVTRAEFAVLLTRALGWPVPGSDTGKVSFTDAAALPVWAREAVATAQARGVLGGYPDGTFRPAQPVTREAAAAILVRVLEQIISLTPAVSLTYADREQIAPWAREAVATACASGIFTGRTPVQFAPQAASTRAEVAVVLHRLLGRVDGENGH